MGARYLPPVFIVLFCNLGCNVINPAEKIPTYIRIDSFKLVGTNPSDITTHAINSAWVYADNQTLGVFELPATIPVLVDSKADIIINAGVNFTGYTAYKVMYPFYTVDTFTLTAKPGEVVNHTPIVKYHPLTNVRYKEDFETGNGFEPFNGDISDDTSLVKITDPSLVYGGKGGSGYIYLTQEHSYSQNINNTAFPIKTGDAYIEIDYKCSVKFEVGLQTTLTAGPVYESIVTIGETDQWKKLYIGVQEFTGRFKTGPYRLIILSELKDGQTEGYVLIDNIKVVSY